MNDYNHIYLYNFILNYNRMYNGIGLQTPRGSGTSGYIQSNISLNQKKSHNREQFLQQLEEKRNANVAPPRKANEEIVEHERKRQILIQTLKLRAKLEAQGLASDVIQQKLKRAEQILKLKFQRGQIQTKTKDTHVMTQAKQKQYMRLSSAFGLNNQIKQGSAFDFDHQRQQRLRKMADKSSKRNFTCEHQGCGKVYDSRQYLQRHLKYKHPKKDNDQK